MHEDAPSNEPITVTLGERTITLRPPTSYTVCREVVELAAASRTRAWAAALGLCWPAPRPKADRLSRRGRREERKQAPTPAGRKIQRPDLLYVEQSGKLSVFAQMFLDALIVEARRVGVKPIELEVAGWQAFALIQRQVYGEDEMQEAEARFFESGAEE